MRVLVSILIIGLPATAATAAPTASVLEHFLDISSREVRESVFCRRRCRLSFFIIVPRVVWIVEIGLHTALVL
jgi:hypothetical protein